MSGSEKIPITLRIDEEIVEAFKKLASQTPGGKYQALMHSALKEYVERGEKNSVEARLARLESVVFKKSK